MNYCLNKYIRSDIVRIVDIFDFEDPANNFYELVLIFDYGEKDRIDVSNIQSHHINKFLNNICMLFKVLKEFDGIYHGNLNLENIILIDNELKIGGFKPRNEKFDKNWKYSIIQKHGPFRFDLFCIGLIWLRFLDFDIYNRLKKEFSLQ